MVRHHYDEYLAGQPGFAGLKAAEALGDADVNVTLVDRSNHHTFQPLLYQVALAVLSPNEIAQPIRAIVKSPNSQVLMDEVVGFDVEARRAKLGKRLSGVAAITTERK